MATEAQDRPTQLECCNGRWHDHERGVYEHAENCIEHAPAWSTQCTVCGMSFYGPGEYPVALEHMKVHGLGVDING